MTQPANAPAKVIVGVDGSPESVAALRYAATISRALGHHLEVLGAWQPRVALEHYTAEWNPERDARILVDEVVKEAFGHQVPDGLQVNVLKGSPVRVLLDASKYAELLVLGTRGRGGFAGMVLGSVSTSLAAHASCPVLIHHDRTISDAT
ncbi:universal stress protein [Paeniglutamicibacter cryotolerans]|uniref:Nucleotide-binding universal stress UspA family protein n=1 Tax=Paeniglutamicibacter cryotolerans TaxID=670079 RepID=A0A839QHZ4_9MICC|nr:universal stress protein [Paeniglutamicibacter cryotolerans]MBB2996008.1 nucleotide-binding universal stress UspA family protein [Paeniglutamicibacter cryotolerans]